MNTLESLQLRNLSPVAKLFVGLFTALMLLVVAWAGFIYYVEEGMIGEDQVPVYSGGTATEVQLDAKEYASDHEHLRDNVGLAHTHINGQTLLFFAIGMLFLFSSAKPKQKKITLWVFATAIVAHAIGLSGRGFYGLFENILTLSGMAILIVIVYMALIIFMDLGRKATPQ